MSLDLAAPIVPIKGIEVELPSNKVRVGISASNMSSTPLTATFENFALLGDVPITEAKFGDSRAK